MINIQAILAEAPAFLDEIFQKLTQSSIDVSTYELDHLCYRVATLDEYRALKRSFSQVADLLHEAQISGRPIVTFKLKSPIRYKNREIFCIEVPAPKASRPVFTGWEHVEFVISERFDDFIQRYSKVKFDMSGVVKAHNPEIELSFGKYAAKFHHVPLEESIRREKEKR